MPAARRASLAIVVTCMIRPVSRQSHVAQLSQAQGGGRRANGGEN